MFHTIPLLRDYMEAHDGKRPHISSFHQPLHYSQSKNQPSLNSQTQPQHSQGYGPMTDFALASVIADVS